MADTPPKTRPKLPPPKFTSTAATPAPVPPPEEEGLEEEGLEEKEVSIPTAVERLVQPPPLFVSNNTPDGIPEHSPDFEHIVRTIFTVDVKPEFDRLLRELTIGEKRGDRGTVAKALDDAESNARRAHALYCAGKIERERLERRCEVILAGMRDRAKAELEREKEGGALKKTITNDDVLARMASHYPDEWEAIKEKKSKAKLMEEHLQELAGLWKSRCASTRELLDKAR